MNIILNLQINERSNKENPEVFHQLVQMPLVKKAQITARTKSKAKQIEEFGEFFAIDGRGEEYLHLLKRIDGFQLDERIALQIDKVIDSSLQGPARELMEHSFAEEIKRKALILSGGEESAIFWYIEAISKTSLPDCQILKISG